MRMSTRARYGARAMAELAIAYPKASVSVKEVAKSQEISPKYLEHIMSSLRAAGLVTAVRGSHGGYALSRPPAAITLRHVVESLDGSLAPVDCVDRRDSCLMAGSCPTRDTWLEVRDSIAKVLEGTTLQDLADRNRQKEASSATMYHI